VTHESQLPPVLDTLQLAALLGIARRTLYDWQKRKDWPFSPIPGTTNRYSRDMVLAAINRLPMRGLRRVG
jgi:hypothetical protein